MKKLRIVFMGTPEFAVGILDTILKNNYEVAAVITAPDKPAGRGQKIKYSAVKEYALEQNIDILQPTNLKDSDFLRQLKDLDANLHVVVAFRMLPKAVWEMPEYGTFNLHASLLPDYRGAAPINWAIINGEKKTGVTTFFIDDKIDTGAMILSAETPISENENAGQLHDRLMEIGSQAVVETLDKIAKGNVETQLQKESGGLKTAYKLNRENCKIDWEKSGTEIHNLIRGLSPYPAAWSDFNDGIAAVQVKIYEAGFEKRDHKLPIGSIKSSKREITVAVCDGFINIYSLQFPGKKKMNVSELLNGMPIGENATFC
ncbi:MAG: methionyl-tRNA formyltransferase [Flavobacterium sp. BFFFF1]|uniref:methionyl-tRNA formyltransferase n=1 Tax=Flavobacterium sp. BFFFF1 TaxID=2015557 RepID=UPI000BD7A0F6|nr:methionyl-tRNA formyltransferase [Flavobacterium sp. BFFFF1]OYU81979.1 MAG: methionyl-tRNA formyltransferase [Flavobacterium sp. BFFFF1]